MIHLYTGNGKGKTTAAIGLALRAAAADKKVFIAYFVKGKPYSENELLAQIPGIRTQQYGRDCFIYKEPEQEDIEVAQKGFEEVQRIVSESVVDVLILDEICIALYYNLSVSQITGKLKTGQIVIARHIAIYLIRNMLDVSLNKIGQIFSNRDHTTIMHSISAVDKMLKTDPETKNVIDALKAKISGK